MRETWYEVTYSDTPKPITVVGETEKMITVEHASYGTDRVSTRRQLKRDCYKAREEAVAAIRGRLMASVESAKRRLEYAEEDLAEFNERES
jgi:hypothetical protein